MQQVANQSEKHIKTAVISVSFLGLYNLRIAKVLLNTDDLVIINIIFAKINGLVESTEIIEQNL